LDAKYSNLSVGSKMAHCPHCLRNVPKEEMLCHTCGAEKGYIHFNRKVRGAIFLVVCGILLPVAVALYVPFWFHGAEILFLPALAVALGLSVFSIYRLVIGPVWYR
jgi:hypothetical protein